MEALNHKLTLEMTALNSQATVHIKKGDTKNKLVISLSENGKPYKITENMHAAFVGKKPDGKIVFNDCDIVGNKITYTITAQTSVAVGIVDCEIRLYDANNNLLTSPTFTIVVDEIIYNADDIQTESENEINVLDSLISEARKLIDEVEKSKFVLVSYGTTHDEIYEAYRNGKKVFCVYSQGFYPLVSFSVGEAKFAGVSPSGKPIVIRCEAPNTWSSSTIDVGGAGTFIAEYDVTPFADIAAAMENGMAVYCKATNNGVPYFIPLTTYDEELARFNSTFSYQSQAEEITLVTYNIFVGADDYWDYDDWNNIAKINFGKNADGTADAVQYIPQTLTEEQQAQARANIGAISSENIPEWARNSEKPTYTASEVGADASGTADNKVSHHNVDDEAHNDIRIELKALADRITAVLDSDDATLDELSEIVAYIKANKTLIDSITTSKVNVSDIINNLTSNVTNKPLSAAQGVALKALIDAIIVPTKVSELTNDKNYLTSFTESDPTVPAWAKQSTKPSYTKSEVGLGNVDNVKQYSASNPPPYPVTKVNGKTGAVVLDAEDVGARADTWLPTPSDIGAEKSGTASSAVNAHNTNETAHNDIRLLIEGLTTRLNALANSTDEDLDQMAELVAYIKANKQLIDSITTSKVSVADIVNNLTTNVSNKPLSAAQGVALKALIDAINVPTKLSELSADASHRLVTDTEKSTWNAKSNFSGAYADLTGQPTIPTVPANISAFNNDAKYINEAEMISELADKLSLGIASDGLIYIFVDGVPVGTGIPQGQTADVYGYIDENNHITFTGKNVPDGSYTCSFDMENGSTVPVGAFVKDTNTYYSITSNLTNCTNSNNTKTVVEGESYSATITANSGYVLKSVSVTMGGSAVSVSGGVINIANVTGNIVITAVAEAAMVNQIPISTDASGNPYVGTNGEKGYKTGYRLSLSSGGESAYTNSKVTGFIPVTMNSVLRIKDIAVVADNYHGIVGYDANRNKITSPDAKAQLAHIFTNAPVNGVYTASGTLHSYGAFSTDSLAYIRICSSEITANSILTVDQEIV